MLHIQYVTVRRRHPPFDKAWTQDKTGQVKIPKPSQGAPPKFKKRMAMIVVAVFTLGLLVQSAMASTPIEIEIEVRNFGGLTPPDSKICGFAYFQRFLISNYFTSATIIENGTHIPASNFGSRILKQIAASKKISFRHVVN